MNYLKKPWLILVGIVTAIIGMLVMWVRSARKATRKLKVASAEAKASAAKQQIEVSKRQAALDVEKRQRADDKVKEAKRALKEFEDEVRPGGGADVGSRGKRGRPGRPRFRR